MIFSKGSKFNSILPIRCPQCHKGKFLERSPYNFSKFTKVRKQCSCCGLQYSMEPSFYFGSMYVAYGIGVALMVATTAISYWFSTSFSFLKTFFVICAAMAVLGPYINALSKIIWANMFFSYKEDSENIKDKA